MLKGKKIPLMLKRKALPEKNRGWEKQVHQTPAEERGHSECPLNEKGRNVQELAFDESARKP